MTLRPMTLGRSGFLALTLATGMAAGASMAVADGPGGGWPNQPWTWSGTYAGLNIGTMDGSDDPLSFGAQLGRNWVSGKMVYGIEGDISLTDSDHIDWFGTVRGRLGYLISPSILLYGTAGLGMIDFDRGGHETELVTGIGVEGKLTQTATVRLEYLNFDDSNVDVVRAGMNWKFNW